MSLNWIAKTTQVIYITQLNYIIEGQENTFNQFEDVVIPIIAKYKELKGRNFH